MTGSRETYRSFIYHAIVLEPEVELHNGTYPNLIECLSSFLLWHRRIQLILTFRRLSLAYTYMQQVPCGLYSS